MNGPILPHHNHVERPDRLGPRRDSATRPKGSGLAPQSLYVQPGWEVTPSPVPLSYLFWSPSSADHDSDLHHYILSAVNGFIFLLFTKPTKFN